MLRHAAKPPPAAPEKLVLRHAAACCSRTPPPSPLPCPSPDTHPQAGAHERHHICFWCCGAQGQPDHDPKQFHHLQAPYACPQSPTDPPVVPAFHSNPSNLSGAPTLCLGAFGVPSAGRAPSVCHSSPGAWPAAGPKARPLPYVSTWAQASVLCKQGSLRGVPRRGASQSIAERKHKLGGGGGGHMFPLNGGGLGANGAGWPKE